MDTTRLDIRARGALAALALALSLGACGGDDDAPPATTPPASTDPRTPIVVNKAADDGSDGTLRAAILKSNAAPGTYRIVLEPPAGSATLVIKPTAALPAIVGPARLEGSWTGSGTPSVAVDGSALLDLTVLVGYGIPANCPGEVAGQFGPNTRSLKNAGLRVVDSHDVEITGFEVRAFCTGIMLLRSRDNHVHHMRLFGNLGAAGLLVTGDSGDAAGTFPTGVSVGNVIDFNQFLDNSDGMDIARGSDGTVVRSNTFTIDGAGIPSSGVEILSSNRIVFEDNTMTGYATALQLGGDNHVFNRNTLVDNAIGVQMGGTGYKFTGNTIRSNRTGVYQTAGGSKLNTLSQNRIFDNGKDISACAPLNGQSTVADAGVCFEKEWLTSRISIGLNGFAPPVPNDGAGACGDGFADCNLPQNTPLLTTSSWRAGGFVVGGTLATRPNEQIVIEMFASHGAGPENKGEGEVYVGNLTVNSGATGIVTFSQPTGLLDPLKDGTRNVYFTATATRVSNGQTSEFSPPQLVAGP
jgi:3-dehydroshikimate dehydratase